MSKRKRALILNELTLFLVVEAMGVETKQLKTKDELVEAICAEDVVPGDESTEAPELSAAMPTA